MASNGKVSSRSVTLTAAYFMMSVAMIIVIATVFRDPVAVVSYERDIWHHLSVFRELIASPFYAANPHVDTTDPSRSYSPWAIFVALVTRGLGGDEFDAIRLSAIGSTALIISGIYFFSRQYWKKSEAPLILFFAVFGTWMIQIDHTGYTTIRTTLFSIGYPYAPVIGLSYWAWFLALQSISGHSRSPFFPVALALLTYIMFITHQLQALFGIGMIGAFLLFSPGVATRRRRVKLCLSVAVGLFLSQFWWYLNPVAYVLNSDIHHGHDAQRFLSYSLSSPRRIFEVLGISIFGLFGFLEWGRRSVRWELTLPFAAVALGFVALLWMENWVSVRILPFVVAILQLGLVSLILERFSRWPTRVIGMVLLALVFFGTVFGAFYGAAKYDRARTYLSGGGIDRLPKTWSATILDATAYAETLVPEGSVAIAHLQTAFPIEASSLSVVAIPRLFAEVPDMKERKGDNDAFFARGTSIQARCAILRKYDVQLIVWRDIWLEVDVVEELRPFGEIKNYGGLRFLPVAETSFSACNEGP